MAVSKVILNGTTLIDVTDDTVNASNLLSGITATRNDGVEITGAYTPPSPSLQSKTATYTPTESQQTAQITADSGYDGLDEVDITVNAISSTYVGSGIVRRSSTDLTTTSGAVTAPSGYYSEPATKAVGRGTANTPATTITANPTISVNANGLITASVSKTQSVTPSVTAGYVTSGTAGTITVSGNNTSQLSVYNGSVE